MRVTAALLVVMCSCGEAGPELPVVAVTTRWAESLGPVPAGVLGHNSVWSRGGLGVWDEAAGAVRPDVRALVADLAPGVLRFPGGTRAMRYHFAGAIGPAAGRTAQCDPFLGVVDGTGYGLDEFLRFAESVGAAVTLVSPWVDGSPEEAAAMIAYANADPSSSVVLGVDLHGVDWGTAGEWGARRAANGHPAPYGVRWLEIGNEQYLDLAAGPEQSCGRPARFRQNERWVAGAPIPTTAADHAAQVALTGALVHAVDASVLVGASAYAEYDGVTDAAGAVAPVDLALATGDAWNARLLADAGDAFDFFVIHPYDLGLSDERMRLAERARAVIHDLRALDATRAIGITEFGFLFDGDTLMNAIVAADMVRVAVEEGLILTLRHILIEDDPAGLFANAAAILGPEHTLTPGYTVMRLLAAHLQAVAVPVTTGDDHVVALATRDDASRTIGLVVIDRRIAADGAVIVEIPLPAGDWRGERHLLSAAGPLARAVDVTHETTVIAATTRHRFELPANGLAIISITLAE